MFLRIKVFLRFGNNYKGIGVQLNLYKFSGSVRKNTVIPHSVSHGELNKRPMARIVVKSQRGALVVAPEHYSTKIHLYLYYISL
jgi:hypothetical protein